MPGDTAVAPTPGIALPGPRPKGARLSGVFIPLAATPNEVARRLHTLIEDDLVAARAEYHAITTALTRAHCTFGGSLLSTFLKPDFISLAEHTYLKETIPLLVRSIETAVRLFFDTPKLAPFFQIDDALRKWVEIEPGYDRAIVLARFDGFLHSGRLHFLEFNVDSPAGVGYADLLESQLLKTAPLARLAKEFKLRRTHRKKALLATLLACYREWGGHTRSPTIAIVDWEDVKTRSDFELIRAYFEKRGYEATIVDPRALEFVGGRLTDGSRRIDLVYRRVLTSELSRRHHEVRAFFEAAKQNAVCVVNPFRARVASSKAIFEMLADPEYDRYFSAEENRIKRRHIPWTQRVAFGFTSYRGLTRDLVKLLREEQGSFVLKPSSGYGGMDVTIGRETNPEDWERILEGALVAGDWIAQEYVPIPEMDVPVFPESGGLVFTPKKINLNPFAFAGRYIGALSRVSSSSVVNVSKGGGILPTITVEPRDK